MGVVAGGGGAGGGAADGMRYQRCCGIAVVDRHRRTWGLCLQLGSEGLRGLDSVWSVRGMTGAGMWLGRQP